MRQQIVIFLILFICSISFVLTLPTKDFKLLSYDQLGSVRETDINFGNELLKGDRVSINTVSKYNGLGTVLVRFTNSNRDSNDELLFELFDNDKGKLIYSALHKTDQFQPDRFFPFGIPPISESAGTNYTIQLTSQNGSTGSGIYFSRTEPVFALRSVVTKKNLFTDPKIVLSLVVNKIEYVLSAENTRRALLLYFVPFLSACLYFLFKNSNYSFLTLYTATLVLFSTKLAISEINYYLVSTVLLWLSVHVNYKLSSKTTSVFIFPTFIMGVFFDILNLSYQSQLFYTWSIAFLILFLTVEILPSKKSSEAPLDSCLKNLDNFSVSESLLMNITLALVKVTYYFVLYETIVMVPEAVYSGYIKLTNFSSDWLPILSLFTSIFSLTILLFFVCWKASKLIQKRVYIYILIYVLVSAYSKLSLAIISKTTRHSELPTITSVYPPIISEAWVDVTINGKNFQSLPFVGKVTLAGEVQVENVHYWSNEKIIFRTNPATTKTGDVCVQTLSKGISNCLPFEYNFNKKK